MQEQVKKDILDVLQRLHDILKSKEDSDVIGIRELSNRVVHNASVFQDEDSISAAVLIYSIYKLIERRPGEINYMKFSAFLEECISSLKTDDLETFRKSIKMIFNYIRMIDKRLKLYVNEVINQAQIKKGCKLCEHGISVARASEVIGISQWELLHYLGKTSLIDKFSEPIGAERRLKIARGLFS